MVGIPYRIVRHGEDGPVDKMIYLATRRTGEAGAAMKKAKRDFQKHELATAKAATRYAAAEAAESKDGERACKLLEEIHENGQAANDAAEHLVLLSLTANYGREKAEEIIDELTTREIRAMLGVIETGELPKDFFDKPGQPPKPISTSPSGGSVPAPSLNADSQQAKSSAEK
jgi:hypothetical protein